MRTASSASTPSRLRVAGCGCNLRRLRHRARHTLQMRQQLDLAREPTLRPTDAAIEQRESGFRIFDLVLELAQHLRLARVVVDR